MSMRTRARHVLGAMLALAVLPGCPTPIDEGGGDDNFVIITDAWREQNNPNHRFLLSATTQDDQVQGSFNGQEILANGTTFDIVNGTWGSNQIAFTVERSSGNVRYSGRITTNRPTQLSLTSSAGSLVIVRGS
jgi:hypothetical protein